MQKKITTLLVCFILLSGFLLNAQETSAEASASHSLVLQTSSLPEAMLGYTFNYKLPFLQGDSPLTENNNINFALTAEISPISLNGAASATWTPIAFIEILAGGRIGTGWDIELFGEDIYGLGITRGTAEREVTNDSGIVGKVYLGGAFQFDLAAVFPAERRSDWNHVLFRMYHEINYAGFSGASGKESWIFENDDGENINGFKYYANAFIGYQMPIFLNMAALLAEAELNLYDIAGKSAWGGDKIQWTLSAILNFAVHQQVEIALLTQFRTRKNYEEDLTKYYYRTMTADKLKLEFYRIATVATYKF